MIYFFNLHIIEFRVKYFEIITYNLYFILFIKTSIKQIEPVISRKPNSKLNPLLQN